MFDVKKLSSPNCIELVNDKYCKSLNVPDALGVRKNHCCGICGDRYGNSNSMFFSVYYNYAENTYYLVAYNAIAGDRCTIDEEDHVIVAMFKSDEKELVVNEMALSKLCSEVNRYWSGSNIPISRFISEILTNHKNEIAGKNVWYLIRTKCNGVNQHCFTNILKYYDAVQSVEKLGEMFIQSICEADFRINIDARDRNKTLEVPKQAIHYIESLDSSRRYGSYHKDYLSAFQKMMGDDPNEIIRIVDYLNMHKSVLSKKIPNQNGGNWYNHAASPGDDLDLLKAFGRIRELRPEIDLRRVLGYLICQQPRQSFDKGYSRAKADPIRFLITIPSHLAKQYADYLATNPVELFPQDLNTSHNVRVVENDIQPTEEEIAKFYEYGSFLSTSHNKVVGDYVFEVPTDYKEFINIGQEFMNCLPRCGKLFYSGKKDIVFVKKRDDDTFKYALELDAYGEVKQAKTYRDLDINDIEVLTAIDRYSTLLQKELTVN